MTTRLTGPTTATTTTTGQPDPTPSPRMVRFAPAVPHAIIGAIVAITELGGPERSDAVRLALTAYLGGDDNRTGDLDLTGRRGVAA